MKGLQGTLKEDFTCKFPFFWLIKEVIDSKWESATSVLGKLNYLNTNSCMINYNTIIIHDNFINYLSA